MDVDIAKFLAAVPAETPDFAVMSLEDVRVAVGGMGEVTGPGLPVAMVRDVAIPTEDGEVPARLYHPQPGVDLPLLVMLFGGGFIAGSIDVIDTPVRQLAVLGRVAVLTPTFRLAPEHPYPAAVNDVEAVLRWSSDHAAELEIAPGRISVGGESSGGAIALAAALRLDPGTLKGLVLIYSVLDTNFDTETYLNYGEGHLLTRAAMMRFWNDYLGRGNSAATEALAARCADLSGLPTTLMAFGEYDVLRHENEALAGRLVSAGVPVHAVRWPGLTHASWYFDHISAAAALANQNFARSVGALLHG